MDSNTPQMVSGYQNFSVNHNPFPMNTPGAYPPNSYPIPVGGPTSQYPPQDYATYPVANQIYPVQIDNHSQFKVSIVNTAFNTFPCYANCSNCKENVTTKVKKKIGCFAWYHFIIYLLFCPCLAWIPFVVKRFRDHVHYCSKCDKKLGVYKRM